MTELRTMPITITPPAQWVNEDRTVCVTIHPSGGMGVMLRDHPDAIWGLEIEVKPEARG